MECRFHYSLLHIRLFYAAVCNVCMCFVAKEQKADSLYSLAYFISK